MSGTAPIPGWATQQGFRIRLEQGEDGLVALLADCTVLVIVDVLSFGTSVDIAIARGAVITPVPTHRDAGPGGPGVVIAGPRRPVPGPPWTLSPTSLTTIAAGTHLVLPSPNGARLSALAGAADGPAVLAGCLRNAAAVAEAAVRMSAGGPIGVIAAGERWPGGNRLRSALEDVLGAGAVVAALGSILDDGPVDPTGFAPSPPRSVDRSMSPRPPLLSPEAAHARDAFEGARKRGLTGVLQATSSGRELIEDGYRDDVLLATAVDRSGHVPVLHDGSYRGFRR
jgi:2-phosphosulfolactate phosphatase